ncbi:MAG TPA: PilZ domain-containing protein [Pyrinomonadaceae bacterium]|nr:PilZ domain-containing protein [Pyrinomonadaceae bacterium]
MNFEGKSRRIRDRLKLSLPLRVRCRESAEVEWEEVTRLLDVTPFGARFSTTRHVERGRLLHLTLPMPRQLRCYDHAEDQYKVWALVRHTKPLASAAHEKDLLRFELGVAFVGKRLPPSAEQDPTKLYDVASQTETGLWNLREMQNQATTEQDREHVQRPETRHNIPVEVTVEVFDTSGKLTASETTVTENISHHGAAVFTTLGIEPGRFVRLTSVQYQISVLAAVRGRSRGADGVGRLHLQFVDQAWPLEGIE